VIGLIAQEVQKVLPEVVYEDKETGLLSVSYAEIVPVLIEAFKQHMADYQNEKEDIHQQLNELRGKLQKIEDDNTTKLTSSKTYQYMSLRSLQSSPRVVMHAQGSPVLNHQVPPPYSAPSYHVVHPVHRNSGVPPPYMVQQPPPYTAPSYPHYVVQPTVSPAVYHQQPQPQPMVSPPTQPMIHQSPHQHVVQLQHQSVDVHDQNLKPMHKGMTYIWGVTGIVMGGIMLAIGFGLSSKNNSTPAFVPLLVFGVIFCCVGSIMVSCHRRKERKRLKQIVKMQHELKPMNNPPVVAQLAAK